MERQSRKSEGGKTERGITRKFLYSNFFMRSKEQIAYESSCKALFHFFPELRYEQIDIEHTDKSIQSNIDLGFGYKVYLFATFPKNQFTQIKKQYNVTDYKTKHENYLCALVPE